MTGWERLGVWLFAIYGALDLLNHHWWVAALELYISFQIVYYNS